jgi:hypothetical protein
MLKDRLVGAADDAHILWKLRKKEIYTSCGMYRSGSTLMFNVVREALRRKYGEDFCGIWKDDLKKPLHTQNILLKTHYVSRGILLKSKFLFYTYRDVRDAILSRQRRFGSQPSIEHVRVEIAQFQRMRSPKVLMIEYNHLKNDLEDVVKNVMVHVLQEENIKYEDIRDIAGTVASQSETSDAVDLDTNTLFHKNHRTYTAEGSWRDGLPLELQKEINNEFAWWFRECGYELE